MDEIPEDIDIESLLAPVPGDAPTGADLREDFSPQSIYFKLRDARAEARAAERQIDADGDAMAAAPPQWRTVRSLALNALATQTKDLEIAAWLTEALLRTDGLAGLTAGSRILAGFAERFWDQPESVPTEVDSEQASKAGLYPMPDEDGIETRVAPVQGLNGQGGDGTLVQPLRKLTLFVRPDGSEMPVWQYEQSVELAAIGDAARREARLAAGVLPFDTVENEARAAGVAHFKALGRAIDAALGAWQALGDVLDAKAGSDSPSTSRVREILTGIRSATLRYSGESDSASDAAGAAGAPAAGGLATAPGMGGGAGFAAAASLGAGPSASREDALRLLNEIANFFQRTEPHSPLAYTLQEAARRGRMTWPDLLEELVPDYTSRAGILSSLGIKPPAPPE